MTGKAFLCEKHVVTTAVQVCIMTGGTIHFAADKAFTTLQQLQLVTMHIQMSGIYFLVELGQFELSESIAQLQFKTRAQLNTWFTRMAHGAHVQSLYPV